MAQLFYLKMCFRTLFGKEQFLKTIDLEKISPAPYCAKTEIIRKSYFDENVKPIIQAHPEIEFICFFPPLSIFVTLSTGLIEYNVRQHVMEALTCLPNVKFYDFESDEEIVCNLNEYKDPDPYSPKIDRYMIDGFKSGKNLVKFNNIKDVQERFRRLQKMSLGEILKR